MTRLVIAGLGTGLVALVACASPSNRVELAIEADTCDAAALGEVGVISVELLGIDDEGRPCALGKRCLFDVGTLASADDVVRVLQDSNQPLVDVADEDAHTVAVIGHRTSCWGTDDHALCGYADLADLEGGVLPMSLQCGGCAGDDIVFCP